MPAASRITDYCTGHGCWPPRQGVTYSPNVKINGLGAHRVSDLWDIHCCPLDGCHASVVASGAANVFINGLPAARIGDSIACGSLIAMGSPNVNMGSQRTGIGSIAMSGDMLQGYVAEFGADFINSGGQDIPVLSAAINHNWNTGDIIKIFDSGFDLF